MKSSLISIVVPIYNVEAYLKRSLDSIINQTYKNIEIILVDDGATDASGDICEQYKNADNRIKVIHKTNGGLSDARNVGMSQAKGEYIAFIDSDDFIHKDYIKKLYTALKKTGSDISICGYVTGNKDSFPRNKQKREVKVFDSQVMLEQWHGKYKHVETMAWNKLYRRELFQNNSIEYPVGFYNEDVQTTHLLVEAAKKIVYINDKLYYYYQRKDSITGSWSNKKIQDNLCSQRVRLDFFEKKKFFGSYNRLVIKYNKYLVLAFFYATNEMKQELVDEFLKGYVYIANIEKIKKWEKLFFLGAKVIFTHITKHRH